MIMPDNIWRRESKVNQSKEAEQIRGVGEEFLGSLINGFLGGKNNVLRDPECLFRQASEISFALCLLTPTSCHSLLAMLAFSFPFNDECLCYAHRHIC